MKNLWILPIFDLREQTFPLRVPSNPLLQEMEFETEKRKDVFTVYNINYHVRNSDISTSYLGSRCFDLSITLKKAAGKSR